MLMWTALILSVCLTLVTMKFGFDLIQQNKIEIDKLDECIDALNERVYALETRNAK